MAQNVIVPIIDLTSAAEGSTVPQNLQTAISFDSQNTFSANNATDVVANNTGFWRVIGVSTLFQFTGGTVTNKFTMSDGLSSKAVWSMKTAANQGALISESFDLIFFLPSGHSIIADTNDVGSFLKGSARQIADVNGVLVNPSGFTPQ